MQIELEVPESLIKKIKALSILGGETSGNLENHLVSLIDVTVSQKIAEAIGVAAGAPLARVVPQVLSEEVSQPRPRQRQAPASDVTGISEGLGDEFSYDDEDGDEHAVTNPEDLIPDAAPSGGLTDDMLASDLEFDEGAASSASPQLDQGEVHTEAMFADTVGIPAHIEEVSHVQRRRQRKTRGKAIVSPYGGG